MNLVNRLLASPRVVTRASRLYGSICSGVSSYSDNSADIIARIQPDVSENNRTLYLTFDDGPGPASMDVIDELNSFGAAATFFFLGSAISEWKDPHALISNLNSGRHAIGLHGYDHLNAWKVQTDTMVMDQCAGLQAIKAIFGPEWSRQLCWARPPYGRLTNSLLNWYASQKMNVALWDVAPVDYLSNPAERSEADVIQFIRRTVRPGSLVLLHANRPVWREGMSALFRTLLEDGWRLAALPT